MNQAAAKKQAQTSVIQLRSVCYSSLHSALWETLRGETASGVTILQNHDLVQTLSTEPRFCSYLIFVLFF